MQCSCGAATQSRKEVKDGKVVTEYERCPECGRVCITWRASDSVKKNTV